MCPLDVTITMATADAEFTAAYRLRYEVFSGEGADYRFADAARRLYVDAFDGPHASLFIAQSPPQHVIGTVRLVVPGATPYFGYEHYRDRLALQLGVAPEWLMHHTAIASRGVVARTFRGRGIASILLDRLEQHGQALDVTVIMSAVALGNQAAMKMLSARGFLPLCVGELSGGWRGTFVYRMR